MTRGAVKSTIDTGALGEDAAFRYLSTRGFELVERNWRCRVGEIDLVCWDADELVIVEVKTRLPSPQAERYLFETITPFKKRKLRALAQIYLASRFSAAQFPTVRIDVVGVILSPQGGRPIIKHLPGAL